MAQVQFRTAN